MEVWKDLPGYEFYQVSSIGRVRSLDRLCDRGRFLRGRLLKPKIDNGYYRIGISLNNKRVYRKISQLVAMAFLGHTPCGMRLVVDHINNIQLDDRVENLRVVTMRENHRTHDTGVSKYKGVHWDKSSKKWVSTIFLNGKKNYLGIYKTELEAHSVYTNYYNKNKII